MRGERVGCSTEGAPHAGVANSTDAARPAHVARPPSPGRQAEGRAPRRAPVARPSRARRARLRTSRGRPCPRRGSSPPAARRPGPSSGGGRARSPSPGRRSAGRARRSRLRAGRRPRREAAGRVAGPDRPAPRRPGRGIPGGPASQVSTPRPEGSTRRRPRRSSDWRRRCSRTARSALPPCPGRPDPGRAERLRPHQVGEAARVVARRSCCRSPRARWRPRASHRSGAAAQGARGAKGECHAGRRVGLGVAHERGLGQRARGRSAAWAARAAQAWPGWTQA